MLLLDPRHALVIRSELTGFLGTYPGEQPKLHGDRYAQYG